jgi:hypothetical protein
VRVRNVLCLLPVMLGIAFIPASARAATCGHVVVLTLPGVTWSDVSRYRPPHLMQAIQEGAAGSMSVRTVNPRTSYADGFASIGAGARMQGGVTAGGIAFPSSPTDVPSSPLRQVQVAGVPEMRALADQAHYGAQAGALGTALADHGFKIAAVGNADPGLPPPAPAGFGRWTLLAAMESSGVVPEAAVDPSLLERTAGAFGVSSNVSRERDAIHAALAAPCSVVVADQGDLLRADLDSLVSGERSAAAIRDALGATDALLADIRDSLDPRRDLLLILSPTSPAVLPAAHLGVAIAVGPGFAPGTVLGSASTRREGFVTLPDVAPTVLSFLHIPEPSVMNGRRWVADGDPGVGRVTAAVATDDEAAFIDRIQPDVSTGFVVFQVAVYLIALILIVRRERSPTHASDAFRRGLEVVVLSVVGFPVATFVGGALEAHRLGVWGMVGLLVAIDAVLVAGVTAGLRNSLDRLLALTAVTLVVLIADLAVGAPLQLSTVFGYSPIVAGRFAGIGNIGFAVLASASVLTGALVVHRQRGSRWALAFAAVLFIVTIVADGSPSLGSDVGGVIALVPALTVTWVLLAGKRPTLRIFLLALGGLGLALVAFLAFDLSRPAASQTHLARLFDDFRAQGSSALTNAIDRKVRANLQVFRSTVWTLSVPPALAVMGWLLLRPRGRWQLLVDTYPRLRAGLVGALLVGVLGFAANDSGIVIPAVVLAFFVPLAVLLHLSLMHKEAG